MNHQSHLGAARWSARISAGALVLVGACADSKPGEPQAAMPARDGDAGASGMPTPDTGLVLPCDPASPTDAGGNHANMDPVTTPDAGGNHPNTEPAITTTLGNTGLINADDVYIQGIFSEDDTILRAPAAPSCVAHLRSGSKPYSIAGTLTVSSDLVGQTGGPPAPVEVRPASINNGFALPNQYFTDLAFGCSSTNPDCADAALPDSPRLFRLPEGARVQFQLSGTASFPALPVTTLRSPVFPTITVVEPLVPESGELTFASTQPLNIRWVPPTAEAIAAQVGGENQQLFVRLIAFSLRGQETVRYGELYCSWPLSAGQGAVPAALLSELRQLLGGVDALAAAIEIDAGEFKEVTAGGASYSLYVTSYDWDGDGSGASTTFPPSTNATLE